MPKYAQKLLKKPNPKTVKVKIDPYLSPMMLMIISDGKEWAENTQKQPDLVGLSENHPKKRKKCDFSKRARNFFLKIGKIHAIYVYIKNQKQTDELPKSQVGCVLGEVCGGDQP